MVKISFDYDRTFYLVKNIIKDLLENPKFDVWVVTARFEKSDNKDLFGELAKIKFPKNKLVFVNGDLKVSYLKSHNFAIHIDDNPKELEAIKNNSNIECYQVENFVKKHKQIIENLQKPIKSFTEYFHKTIS